MSVPLLLVASSGLARETAEAARASGFWTPVGFLDDDPARHGSVVDGLPVLGGSEAFRDHPQASVVLCPGKGAARLGLDRRLRALGLPESRYATVIHPGVDVPATCSVGAGSVLLAGTVLTAGVRVGRHVVCMPRVVMTHDDVVEDGATLCAGVTLGGSVRIASAAYLGMSCCVRQNLRVGAGATIGMGAVVLADVPDGQTWIGVPAAQLASRKPLSQHAEPRAEEEA